VAITAISEIHWLVAVSKVLSARQGSQHTLRPLDFSFLVPTKHNQHSRKARPAVEETLRDKRHKREKGVPSCIALFATMDQLSALFARHAYQVSTGRPPVLKVSQRATPRIWRLVRAALIRSRDW
jgi:hypothetical protein